jgi:hypothetical protein
MRLAETIFVDCVEIAHAQPLQTCYVRPDPPRPGSRPRRPGIRAADHGRGQACCGSPSAIWDAGRCSSKWPIDRRRSRASTERPGARSGLGRAPRSPSAPSRLPKVGFASPEIAREPAGVRPSGRIERAAACGSNLVEPPPIPVARAPGGSAPASRRDVPPEREPWARVSDGPSDQEAVTAWCRRSGLSPRPARIRPPAPARRPPAWLAHMNAEAARRRDGGAGRRDAPATPSSPPTPFPRCRARRRRTCSRPPPAA